MKAYLLDNQFTHNVRDFARQIWLAGLGAFARAQDEGGRFFETLVQEGQAVDAQMKKTAGEKIEPGEVEIVKGKDGKPVEKYTGKRAVVVAGFHSLRHTFVSLHAQAGTPQAVLMKLAGHGNPMMKEHYTHISEATARQSAAALPAIIGEPPVPHREPMPEWIRNTLETMTPANWRKVRTELLAEPA